MEMPMGPAPPLSRTAAPLSAPDLLTQPHPRAGLLLKGSGPTDQAPAGLWGGAEQGRGFIQPRPTHPQGRALAWAACVRRNFCGRPAAPHSGQGPARSSSGVGTLIQ